MRSGEEGREMHEAAAAALSAHEASQQATGGAQVIPLFRGQERPEQPLVTLGNGLWKKLDVQRALAVSSRTVERWMKEEGLPHAKPFGHKGPVRYDPRKVLAWWDARCANGGDES